MTSVERDKQAVKLMLSAGLEPLEPYVNSLAPWRCKCLECGNEVEQSLKSIQQRTSARKGCKQCAPNARVTPQVAVAKFIAANLEPIEPFVNTTTKWKSKCMKCGRIVNPTYSVIKRGQSGCAHCSGKIVDPSKARELFIANELEPLVEYPGASVPWKSIHIPCGKEVTPTFSNIRQGHSGCKYCVGNVVDEEKARLLFISRGLLPIEPYRNALVGWKSIHQECGNIFTPRYNTVQQGSSGCRHCSGNMPILPTDAEALMLSKQLTPLEAYPGTNMPWKCRHTKCGNTVYARYSLVKRGSSGCKSCAGIYVDPKHAQDVFLAAGLIPAEPYQSSQSPWLSTHQKCGRLVSPTYTSVNKGISGCAYCAGNKVDADEANELFVSRGLVPQEPFPGAKKPWKCTHAQCGRTVYPKYSNVYYGSCGCRDCAANYVNPEYALEVFKSADLEPMEAYPGTDRGWRSIHLVCGREVNPRYGYVRTHGAGCKYCAGKSMLPSEAVSFINSRGFEPLEEYPSSQTPWKLLHTACGETVSTRLNTLKYQLSDGTGCAKCSYSGFNYSLPAILYLLTHKKLGSHKIGIAGATKKRIEHHSSRGWEVVQQHKFETGEEAYLIEQELLNWFREELGIPVHLTKADMPQGGYTETVDESEISLSSIWDKMNLIRTDT